jgi:hypothetical protein
VGAVTTHFASPRRSPDDATATSIQRHADECARWLRWYDATAMPRIVSTVHAAARSAKAGEPVQTARAGKAPSPPSFVRRKCQGANTFTRRI